MASYLEQVLADDRNRAKGIGDQLTQEAKDDALQRGYFEDAYRQKGDDYWWGVQNDPAYTPEEFAAIRPDISDMRFSDADYDSYQFTPEEMAEQRGDPFGSLNRNRGDLSVSGEYLPGQRGTLENGGSTQRGIIQDLRGDLDLTAGDDLGASQRFLDTMGVTDDELAGLEQVAANAVRTQAQNAQREVGRRATQSGQTNPAAIANTLAKLNAESGNLAAEKALEARLSGMQLRRDTERAREDTRMRGAGTLSDARYRGATAGADRALGVESGLLDRGMDLERDYELMRQGASRDIADRDTAAEEAAAGRGANIASRNQQGRQTGQQQRYLQDMGVYDFNRQGAQTTGDARRQDQQAAASYFERQQRANQDLGEAAKGRKQQTYSTQVGANIGNSQNLARVPEGQWDKIGKQIGAGAIKAGATALFGA